MRRAMLKYAVAIGLLGVGGCVSDVDYDSPAYDYYGGRYGNTGYYDDYYGPGPWLYSGYPYYWRHRHHYDGGGAWDHESHDGHHNSHDSAPRDRGSISSGRVPWDSPRTGSGTSSASRSTSGSSGGSKSSGGGGGGSGHSGGGSGGGSRK